MEFYLFETRARWEEVFPLLRELAPALTRARYRAFLDHPLFGNHRGFGLRGAGRLVAAATAWELVQGLGERLLWINAFVVTEDLRGRGYGKRLLSGIETWARKNGYNEIRVHAHRDGALRFWQTGAGYRSFSTAMKKELPPG